jgi:hypothetical protein
VEQQGAEWPGEFFKNRLVSGECKNPFEPEPPSYRCDGIGERHVLLAAPLDRTQPRVAFGQLAVQGGHDGVQPEQARRLPQHGPRLPTARRLQTQVRAHFLKGRFLVPATDVGFDHFRGAAGYLGGCR